MILEYFGLVLCILGDGAMAEVDTIVAAVLSAVNLSACIST